MAEVMKTPRSVDMAVTHKCNLRCRYCSHFSGPGDVGVDLPTDAWLRFFEELGRCAVMEATIQGGEPFSRADIKELINGIIKNRMRFSILSNGILITDDLSAFLSSTGRCNHVQVSIDGSKAEIHDSFRGQGTFEKAIAGLQKLRKHQVPVTVRVTIHRRNVHDLENIARFLLEELELPAFSTNAASFMGLCRQNRNEVQLSIEERSLAMESLIKLYQRYKGRINAAAGPLADILQWSKMEQARLRDQNRVFGEGHFSACGGVFNNLAVRADGIMVPCIQLSHIELGRINRDNLKEIWQNHSELIRLRNRRHKLLNAFSFCRECIYIPYCTGNCPALAYNLTGQDEHPSPDACLKRFLDEGGRLPIVENLPL